MSKLRLMVGLIPLVVLWGCWESGDGANSGEASGDCDEEEIAEMVSAYAASLP